jgi:hypothetical protein
MRDGARLAGPRAGDHQQRLVARVHDRFALGRVERGERVDDIHLFI